MCHVSQVKRHHTMSDFVNYNRRSIKLQPGCKDMMHVLHPGGLEWLRSHFGRALSGAVVRSGSAKGRISEIGKTCRWRSRRKRWRSRLASVPLMGHSHSTSLGSMVEPCGHPSLLKRTRHQRPQSGISSLSIISSYLRTPRYPAHSVHRRRCISSAASHPCRLTQAPSQGWQQICSARFVG